MDSIKANNEKLASMAQNAWEKFYATCNEDYNLTDKSIASLLGVSRQTVCNWSAGKGAPCVGTVMRIKMVHNHLNKAQAEQKLPAPSRNKQEALVKEILG